MFFMSLKYLNFINNTCRDNYLFLFTKSKRMSLFNFGILILVVFDLASFITYFNGFILDIREYIRMLLMVYLDTGAATQ